MKDALEKHIDWCKITRLDVIIIVLILVSSVFSIFRISPSRKYYPKGLAKVRIYVNDRLFSTNKLSEDKMINLPIDKMQVEVKRGRVRVVRADCPEHVCMNMGWIKYPDQTIVCVPNKVLVEIVSADVPFLDAVVR
ncbi:MAG: NusG domain II-containing protein [Candidatus Omnitrophota bacterium]